MPLPTKSVFANRKNVPSGNLDPVVSEPAPGRARGESFILLHGLNLRPERLAPWREFLLEHGFGVVSVTLAGHRSGTPHPWRGADADGWLAQVGQARDAAGTAWPGGRVSLFGYSLGAVLGMVRAHEQAQPWHRAILLAPAFRVRGWGHFAMRAGGRFLPPRLLLPSLAPRAYRVHGTTPVSAFMAVWELGKRFSRALAAPANPRGPYPFSHLVIYAPGDELISTSFLVHYRERIGEEVELYRLDLEPTRRYPRHLAIDPRTAGEPAWSRLLAHVARWLEESAQPTGSAS